MLDRTWRIELLGTLRAVSDERVVTHFRTQKAAGLLGRLAYVMPGSLAREELVESLWPESTPEAGRLCLRQELSSLRKQLETPGLLAGSVIVADRQRVALAPAAVSTDLAAYEAALKAAAAAREPSEKAGRITEAVALYRGELLSGCYDEWVFPERERLAEWCLTALCQLARQREAEGDARGAIDLLLRACVRDPLRESVRAALMRIYAAIGLREQALRQYEEFQRLLLTQLGARPSSRIREIARRLRDEPADQTPSGPDVTAAAPKSESSANTPGVGVSAPAIPMPLTRFFGRTSEIRAITIALNPSEQLNNRLLTLTGPGGSGKTRLALEVARTLADRYPNSIWFVPLADVEKQEQVPDAILSALRLPRHPAASAMDQVTAHLTEMRGLLVLDNMEHLLAADECGIEDRDSLCASIVRRLLESSPGLRCMVTSRQPLGIAGEREIPVPPLPTPAAHSGATGLLSYASVQLYADRAQSVRPDFEVNDLNADAVGTLCRRLEGIPLALELAAAWARTLTPAQMVVRLGRRFDLLVSRSDNTPPRHRTLRAAVEGSYQLLSPELQACFSALSVFRGGWTLSSAECVLEASDVVDIMTRLQERSLLIAEETTSDQSEMRYRMLETLREYAAEQLAPDRHASLSFRHLCCYRDLAVAAVLSNGDDLFRAFDRLEPEQENIRACLGWALATGRADCASVALKLTNAMARFWSTRGRLKEASSWLERTLDAATEAPPQHRAEACNSAGILVGQLGDYAMANTRYSRALAIWEEMEDEKGIASVLSNMGADAREMGNLPLARELGERALAISRKIGNVRHLPALLNNLGIVARRMGDLAGAERLQTESLERYRELGDVHGAATALLNLGFVWCAPSDPTRAYAAFEEVLRIVIPTRDHFAIIGCLEGIATCATWLGAPEVAARLWGAITSERTRIGLPGPPNDVETRETCIGEARAALSTTEFAAMFGAGTADTIEDAVSLALAPLLSGGHH